MASSIRQSPDSYPVNGVADGTSEVVNKVDLLPDLTLPTAKAQLGAALRDTVKRSDSVLKQFGDKGQMSRVLDGEDVPAWLARIWAHRRTRRELVIALAERSGLFDTRLQMTEKG